MMILKVLITILLLPFFGPYHDIHVSVCDVEFKDQNIEITLKTFLDDLQVATGLVPGEELPDGYTSADVMIQEYLTSTIEINVNGQLKKLNIDDITASLDAVWISINVDAVHENLKNIQVKSSFLTDVYNDQTNIINIKRSGEKDSYILNKKKKVVDYELD